MAFMGYCPNCDSVQVSGTFSVDKCKICKTTFKENSSIMSDQWDKKTEEEKQAFIDMVKNGLSPIEEAKKKQMENEKYITTSCTFEGKEIEEYCGTVSAIGHYLVNTTLNLALKDEDLYDTVFTTAKTKMFNKAKDLGGNAIVSMQVNIVSPNNANLLYIVTSGTAVKLKEI